MAQVQEFCRRLRVSAAVNSQALEYYRLSELKCARGSISSSCMALICMELAASQLRETFDKVIIWPGLYMNVRVCTPPSP